MFIFVQSAQIGIADLQGIVYMMPVSLIAIFLFKSN